MDVNRLTSTVARVFTLGAYLFLAAAVVMKALSLAKVSTPYNPRTLLDWAAILLILVVPLLLRQIREELKKPRT